MPSSASWINPSAGTAGKEGKEETVNIEHTIEFMLKEQAGFEARIEAAFVKSNQRMDRIERVLGQTNRVVARMASLGVSLRQDLRGDEKAIARHEKWLADLEAGDAKHKRMMDEFDAKLSALTDIVARSVRGNGRQTKKAR
jgi:hypothetical protein